MPTERRYEGSTQAEVLAKIRKNHGENVKFLSAHRIRTGGIFGFFAREKVEIIIELDDTPAPAPAPTPAPASTVMAQPTIVAGTSIEDIVGQINATERGVVPQAPSAAGAPAKAAKPKAPKSKPIKAAAPPPPPAAPEVDPTPPPAVSTESADFAAVLSRMAFQADMQDDPQGAHYAKSEEPEEEPVDVEEVLTDDEYENVSGDAVYVEPEVVSTAEDDDEDDEDQGPVIPGRPSFLDARTTVPPAASTVPAVPVPTAGADAGVAVPVARTRKSDSPLAHLGVPVQYIPERIDLADTVNLRDALAAALEALPKAPVLRPSRGSIIAVVGEREAAMSLAEELADSFGRPRDEVVLASPDYKGREIGAGRLIRSVRDAEDSQRSWQRRNRPTIVAIEASLGSKATTWAEHVLTALEPIATYGVTNATIKPEDIAAWATGLGGIDCLAINHVQETVSPAAVLATGIPVDRLDGRQASPAYWAMILSERLSAA